jgi:hypothetical protein
MGIARPRQPGFLWPVAVQLACVGMWWREASITPAREALERGAKKSE